MASRRSTSITVAVRIRPPPPIREEGGSILEVMKILDDNVIELSVKKQKFQYDHVFHGTGPTQADVYHSVGEPLVRNAMAG